MFVTYLGGGATSLIHGYYSTPLINGTSVSSGVTSYTGSNCPISGNATKRRNIALVTWNYTSGVDRGLSSFSYRDGTSSGSFTGATIHNSAIGYGTSASRKINFALCSWQNTSFSTVDIRITWTGALSATNTALTVYCWWAEDAEIRSAGSSGNYSGNVTGSTLDINAQYGDLIVAATWGYVGSPTLTIEGNSLTNTDVANTNYRIGRYNSPSNNSATTITSTHSSTPSSAIIAGVFKPKI